MIKIKIENKGVLISSGLIAGEALMAVILAFLYLGQLGMKYEYFLGEDKISFLKNFAVTTLGVQNPSAIAGFFGRVPGDIFGLFSC